MKTTIVLIIEDNVELLENTAELLATSVYKVLTADNGKQGIEIAKEKRPGIILCDISMPVIDGFGVLDALKKDPETKDIPFVFLTGKSQKTEIAEGLSLGARAYLLKPITAEELIKTIRLVLHRQQDIKKSQKVK